MQIITRLVIFAYAVFHNYVVLLEFPSIIVAGFINDLVSLSYAMPFALLFSLVQLRALRLVGYFLVIFALTANLLSELCFFDEFGTRYNFIAVDYLIYTQEIIGTLRESLPVAWIISGLFFVSLIATMLIQKLAKQENHNNARKTFARAAYSCVVALLAFKCYDSDKLILSDNIYARELGKNGFYEFFSAFRNNSLDYIKFYKTIDKQEALSVVRSEVLQENQSFLKNDGIDRHTISSGTPQNYNIVLIVIESMSAEYMRRFGNAENITPNLDKLTTESVFFTKLYAAGTRTVRGLEAVTLGVPPIPGASIVRQEANGGLFNLGSVLRSKGYDVNFLYGGFSYFDNLENYFNGNGYRVVDRNNLQSHEISFANIWGVADEDIFNKSIQISDESYENQRPFFSLIMTTSNHRPYTFPEGRIDRKPGSRNAAVMYTDYAVGKFIESSRHKPWFDNTIFVITADHCASSAGKTQLPIEKYHIPLMIYAPKILQPRVVHNIASQIDIPPTVLGLLNMEYDSKFIGSDIIHFPANRAFIGTYQLLGYIKDDSLVILAPKGEVETRALADHVSKDKNIDSLVREAISFYQTSYLLFQEGKMKDFGL